MKRAAHNRLLSYSLALAPYFAVRTGLEPATPCVTGRYSNQLNYHSAIGGYYRTRTYNPRLVRAMLYQLS